MANTFFILFLVLSLFIFFIKRKLNRKKLKYTNYISLENIPQEFEEIYTNVYNNHILNLKKMEKEAKRAIVSQNIIISIIVLGIILWIL